MNDERLKEIRRVSKAVEGLAITEDLDLVDITNVRKLTRQDIPDLLDEVERLRKERDELQGKITQLYRRLNRAQFYRSHRTTSAPEKLLATPPNYTVHNDNDSLAWWALNGVADKESHDTMEQAAEAAWEHFINRQTEPPEGYEAYQRCDEEGWDLPEWTWDAPGQFADNESHPAFEAAIRDAWKHWRANQ